MGMFDWFKPKPTTKPPAPFKISRADLQNKGFTNTQVDNMMTAAFLENSHGAKQLFDIDETRLGVSSFKALNARFAKPAIELKDYAKNSFNLSAALTSLWNTAVATRRDYLLVAEEVTQHYLINRMMRQIVADVLNKDLKGEIIKFTSESDDPRLQEELDNLFESYDFNYQLQDMTKDLLNMGEFSLRLSVDNGDEYDDKGNVIGHHEPKGVVAIDDDLDQVNIIAFYEQGWPKSFLHLMKGKYIIEPAHKFAHFILGDKKYRIALQDLLEQGYMVADKTSLPPEVRKELPDYVRVGQPLFMGVIPKLRELQMLETLIPATKLNQATQSQIVGIKIPAATATEDVAAILQQFEDLLNVPVGLDKNMGQLTISEIVSVAGKIRCVPYFDDGKGALDPVDARKNQAVDDILASLKDIRSIICTSIGIPYSLLFGSEDKEKAQELRLFSSYTRMLADIQESLSRGIKQIIAVHLANKGFDKVSKKDFDVKWLQPLTDIAGLEAADLMDAKQELAGRTLDFVDKMMSNKLLAPRINRENVVQWVTDKFNKLTDGLNLFNDIDDPNILMQQQQAAQQQALQGDFPQNKPPVDPNQPQAAGQDDTRDPNDPTKPTPASNVQDFASGEDPGKDKKTFGLDNKI